MIIGSCGHEVTIDTGTINTKDFDREGKRCVVTQVVCDKCLKWYKKKKLILSTEQEEKDWFDGKIKYKL